MPEERLTARCTGAEHHTVQEAASFFKETLGLKPDAMDVLRNSNGDAVIVPPEYCHKCTMRPRLRLM